MKVEVIKEVVVIVIIIVEVVSVVVLGVVVDIAAQWEVMKTKVLV